MPAVCNMKIKTTIRLCFLIEVVITLNLESWISCAQLPQYVWSTAVVGKTQAHGNAFVDWHTGSLWGMWQPLKLLKTMNQYGRKCGNYA